MMVVKALKSQLKCYVLHITWELKKLCRQFIYVIPKLITILIAIVLALGGWNLKEVYSISKDMVLLKEKVNQIEEDIQKFSKKKPKKKKKKNN